MKTLIENLCGKLKSWGINPLTLLKAIGIFLIIVTLVITFIIFPKLFFSIINYSYLRIWNSANISYVRMKEAIINLIKKWACCHDWQIKKEIEVECDGGTVYHKFIFVCKKCGKFKTLNSRKI